MVDPLVTRVFGDAPVDDPYDGLPPHMVAGRPLTVQIEVTQGHRRVMKQHADGRGHDFVTEPNVKVHTIQLERDGVPLTLGDRRPRWVAGTKDGWR